MHVEALMDLLFCRSVVNLWDIQHAATITEALFPEFVCV